MPGHSHEVQKHEGHACKAHTSKDKSTRHICARRVHSRGTHMREVISACGTHMLVGHMSVRRIHARR